MNSNGKMSLVVLRSWSDGPPKIRAIAPPDDDRAIYVPDHQGRFVTEEASEAMKLVTGDGHHVTSPRYATSGTHHKELVQKDDNSKSSGEDVVYRKTPLQRCFAIGTTGESSQANRHSYSGIGASPWLHGGPSLFKGTSPQIYLSLQGVDTSGKDSPSRPDSLASPDNPDASSLEYTPPASPVNGRYRNLGPELAATIPKRTVRNSWIAEVKQRWNNKSSRNTTHPSSRLSSRQSVATGVSKRAPGSNLKSYSSSPSLIYRNKEKGRKGVGKSSSEDEGEEEGDYFVDDERYTLGGNGETPHHHRRNSLQRIHLDEQEESEQQPFFNPLYKFAQTDGKKSSAGGTIDSCDSPSGTNSNFTFVRNQVKSPSDLEGESGSRTNSSTSSGCHVASHHRSPSGLAMSVDDDTQSDRSRSSLGYPPSNNSANTSYSPSPPLTSNTPNDHIYSSLTDIHEVHTTYGKVNGGRLDPFKLGDTSGSSDVVLVEVIRKQGKVGELSSIDKTGSGFKTASPLFGDKYNLQKFGSVELIQKLGVVPSLPAKQHQLKLGKRHSVDVVDSSVNSGESSKQPLKIDGGKVQRFKESLKRFGRFGRSNTDKIVRTQSDSGFSTTDEIHGAEFRNSPEQRIATRSESGDNSLYETPKEIIVTNLKDAENDTGITVKPAPRRRSKPSSEVYNSSRENIYAKISNDEVNTCEVVTSELLSQRNDCKNVTDEGATKLLSNGSEEDTPLMKRELSDNNARKSENSTTASNEGGRISPIAATRTQRQEICDEVDDEEDDDEPIPHLEFDKGGENENSTSHDESCSSRAESLTYSSTSHEQDRSMPQQIVQLVQQKHLIPKVDIVSSEDGTASSLSASSSDTLNCEVTPVIRKHSFDTAREESGETETPNSAGCSINSINNKQPVAKQISSSFGESSNNNNCNEGNHNGNSLVVDQKEESGQSEEQLNKSDANQRVADAEGTGCTAPVTLNESSDKIGSSEVSECADRRRSMNSLSKTNSREIFNGLQKENEEKNNDLYNSASNDQRSKSEQGLEIMTTKVERGLRSGSARNGMGKHENGTASVQVPVQAVNRNVLGYGLSLSSANSVCSNSLSEDHYNGSVASTMSKNDSDWNRSSLRASLKGFCQDMLQQENVSIPVPDVVEGVINFEEDSSSIEHDEERENSIEYISVANVKVNRERKLERLHPRDDVPSCVIALDLGSRGSGYAYWIKEENDFVRIGNVDGGSSCPASHKAPSWVMFDDLYLDGDEEEETSQSIRPGFGFQALDKYLTDDAHGQLSWRWREHFQESKSFPYTLESKASDEDLIFMMKSTIRHYGRQALEQINQRKRGLPPGPSVLLVAIPSTFDLKARQLVREAALETGLLREGDSVALIEDSCATGLYSLHALKAKLAKEFSSKELSYLSVDCGASYLHFSGYQVSEGKLRQLIIPRSEPLIDSPESLFEAELSTVFTPTYIFNYQNKHKAGWLKLMTEFENAKNRFDPLSKQNYYIFMPSSFVDQFRRFTSMEVEDALESSDIVWNKTGAMGIPSWKMQRFLQPLLDYVTDKIITSLKKFKFEHLLVTGGRAGAKFYIDSIRAAVKPFGVTLHVPKEYNAAVLQGSTISVTNLAPRLVIRSKFSIGVGVMTPFSEDTHPEEKRVMRDGKSWCADVWDSLIRADEELELNRVIIKRSYVGAQPGQSLLVLPLFKSPEEPKFVTESTVQKCCELKFTSGQRAWQEVELVLVCRPSEILIKAMDGGVMKSYVVVDFAD